MEIQVISKDGKGEVALLWNGKLGAVPVRGQSLFIGGRLYGVTDVVWNLPESQDQRAYVSITVLA